MFSDQKVKTPMQPNDADDMEDEDYRAFVRGREKETDNVWVAVYTGTVVIIMRYSEWKPKPHECILAISCVSDADCMRKWFRFKENHPNHFRDRLGTGGFDFVSFRFMGEKPQPFEAISQIVDEAFK